MANAGIYCIRNTYNDKRYVGSSRNISGRWRVHRSKLRLNKHHSDHLQKSYNIEPSRFIYEIIELVDDLLQLEIREQFWVDYFQSYKSDFGYNSVRTVSKIDPSRMRERWAKPGAKKEQSQRMKDVCSSEEHRKKLSIGHIEYFRDPNNRLTKLKQTPHRKGVICVNTGQIFLSINQAAKELGVSIVKIRDSASGKRKSNGLSFRWI